METATETDAAALTTTSVIERAIERVADALGASTRTLVVVFVTCAVGAVVARMMMTTTTTRARDDASPMGANDERRHAASFLRGVRRPRPRVGRETAASVRAETGDRGAIDDSVGALFHRLLGLQARGIDRVLHRVVTGLLTRRVDVRDG